MNSTKFGGIPWNLVKFADFFGISTVWCKNAIRAEMVPKTIEIPLGIQYFPASARFGFRFPGFREICEISQNSRNSRNSCKIHGISWILHFCGKGAPRGGGPAGPSQFLKFLLWKFPIWRGGGEGGVFRFPSLLLRLLLSRNKIKHSYRLPSVWC